MEPIVASAAKVAIQEMFRRGYVDIVAVRNICELLCVPASGKSFEILRLIHCVNFSNLPEDLKRQIPVLLKEVFRRDQFDLDLLMEAIDHQPAARPRFFQRLIGN